MTDASIRGRSVFVTGAFGLVGSQLAKALVDAGAEITVLKRDDTVDSALELEGTLQRVNVVRGDICDGSLIERVLSEYEVDTVFHLAAQTIVGVANAAPLSTFEANIRGTWTMLEACRHTHVQHTIVAASDKAYGVHKQLPYREDHALAPLYPYDVSKAAADMITRSYWHTFQMSVAVTRFANVYGGGDQNLSRLVPEGVLAALAGRPPVIRSDGKSERDFLYVQDAVRAYLAVWDLLRDGSGAGEAFNAGGDAPHSVLEVIALLCEVAGTGVTPDVRGFGTPAGEIERQYVDSSKLRTMSGWEPEVTLRDGLRRTVDWYREYVHERRA